MRRVPALLAGAALLFSAVAGHAQSAQVAALYAYSGDKSQTTPAFQVPDSWEVQWQAPRNCNVAVLAGDGSVVGGGAGTRGAIFIPKGGNYHLQIDYPDLPPMPDPSATAQPDQNPYNPATRDGYNDQPNNNGAPSPNPSYNSARVAALMQMRMRGPYSVNIVPAGAPVDTSPTPANLMAMPYFKLPSGSTTGTMTASYSGGTGTSAATPAPAPAATPTPAGPAANLSQDQARAVVLIKGDNGEGTGFLVKTKDGPVVITNQHVLANNPNIQITTSTGLTIVPLAFKGATDRDLAMISIKDAGYSYLALASDVTAVSPGDQVVTPGNSEGGEVMLNTNGKVLAIGPDRIEIDNPIYHGNSGGPVYDGKTNQVVGVVTEAIKVDTSDELDKASFASRSSAIQGAMRFFAMRVDNVPKWEDLDWKSFQGETAFLDKFDQRSRSLDSFLNSPTPAEGQQLTDEESREANLWRQDTTLVRANEQFEDQATGNVDSGQKLDALRELLGAIVDAANSDVATIQNVNNFYMYDRQRASEEMEYRQALKNELDRIGNDVSRLGGLARRN
jgi:S1-C subfamily serine protease